MSDEEANTQVLPTQQKKAMRKREAEEAMSEWTNSVTLESIILSSDCTSVVTIGLKPVEEVPVRILRVLCVRFKISGYKNRKREEILSLLCERKKNDSVEKHLYGVGSRSVPNDGVADVDGDNADDRSTTTSASYPDKKGEDCKMPASVLSPLTRSAATKAAAPGGAAANVTAGAIIPSARKRRVSPRKKQMDTSSSKKKTQATKSKATPPAAVTMENTYYRAINVWFDDRHRKDIVYMGSSPSIQELDARKRFANKATYDKLLVTYLSTSQMNKGLNFIGFNDKFLNDLQISGEYAAEFDILHAEELSCVIDYIHYWYNVSHRNNQTSGTNSFFGQMLLMIPPLLTLSLALVPQVIMLTFINLLDRGHTCTTIICG